MEQILHSTLSFSGRERWSTCSASVAMSIDMPDKSSAFAAEGTIAHTFAEHYVAQHFGLPGVPTGDPQDAVPPEGLEVDDVAEWNARMRKHGKAYADFLESLVPPGEEVFVVVEQRVAIPSISTRLFGTSDCLMWFPRLRKLIVPDYKYGRVAVALGDEADTNKQIAAYAVAAIETFKLAPLTIGFAIFQPNHPLLMPRQYAEWPAQPWLEHERAKIAAEVAATVNPGEPVPGAHCRYCKGAPRCPRFHEVFAMVIGTASRERSLQDLSDLEVLQAYTMRPYVKAFFEDVEQRVLNMAKENNPVVSVSLSQGALRYKDEKAAAATLAMVGRFDLLRPQKLSDALDAIPPELRGDLLERGPPRKTIRVLGAGDVSETVKSLRKFSKTIDNTLNRK